MSEANQVEMFYDEHKIHECLAEIDRLRAELDDLRASMSQPEALRTELIIGLGDANRQLTAELTAARNQVEAAKNWKESDPYYLAGKRAAESAIAKWEKESECPFGREEKPCEHSAPCWKLAEVYGELAKLRALCAEAADHGDCGCYQDDTCPFIRLTAAGRGEVGA